jgi:hypothetical protein
MTRLPASGHATPITYRGARSGRQFVAIAAGGGNKYNTEFTGKLVVFALPQKGEAPEPRLISAVSRVPRFRADYKGAEEKLPVVVAPQPVPFSHRLHAGKARIDCTACHPTAMTEGRAGLPDGTSCLTCHRSGPSPAAPWVRVYKLPDFVFFSHQRHVNVACADCHGPVAARDVLAKEVSTSMTACMACHVQRKASIDCGVCHELGQ